MPINGCGKSRDIGAGGLDGYLKSQVNWLAARCIAAVLEKPESPLSTGRIRRT
jgi:hypothetical protein